MGGTSKTPTSSGCPSLRLAKGLPVGASSSVGQSTRLISVGSEVQVLPGPFRFRLCRERNPPEGRAARRPPAWRARASCAALPRSASYGSGSGCSDLGCGGLAQLVEHLLCKQGVSGSNPLASMRSTFCRLAEFSTSLASFPPGPWPRMGMFFETVNRIWRMNVCLGGLSDGAAGWDGLSECV